MNITITEVATGKKLHEGLCFVSPCRVAIYAMTADGAVYRHNELCEIGDRGDLLSEADEVMYFAQYEGIETDEWTLVRDPRPANHEPRIEVMEISAGNTITDGQDAHVYVKGTDGSVWRYYKRLGMSELYQHDMSYAEYLMDAVFDRGSINPQYWTQVRGGAA